MTTWQPDPRDVDADDLPGGGVDRRTFLRRLVELGAGSALAGILGSSRAGAAPIATSFPDGVMSGDPSPGRGTLRTRVEPPPDGRPLPVIWLVATDPGLRQVVRGGLVWATAAHGHSVHAFPDKLGYDRWLHYGFFAPGARSQVGRMRIAPRPGSSPDVLKYAFCSCQQRGPYYVAHKSMVEEGIDFFLHLGDYIYVSDDGDITLDDYRRRWRIFQSDPDLQNLQAQVPIVPVWDDGEFYNGVDRTGDPTRLADARSSWFEAMPVKHRSDDRIYRRLPWGDLADMLMIDTRQYRDPEVPANDTLLGFDVQDTRRPPSDQMFDPGRTTLGRGQRRWLERRLRESAARWKLIGNSYNIAPWKIQDFDRPQDRAAGGPDFVKNGGLYVSNEAWDDYAVERRELLEAIERDGVENVIFTSGHTHFYLASTLQADYDDPAAKTVAFDFVTGSLTADPHWSDFVDDASLLKTIEFVFFVSNEPYLKYTNMFDNGYSLVTVTPEETIVEYRMLETLDPNATARTGARFRVRHGSDELETLFDERPIPRIPPS